MTSRPDNEDHHDLNIPTNTGYIHLQNSLNLNSEEIFSYENEEAKNGADIDADPWERFLHAIRNENLPLFKELLGNKINKIYLLVRAKSYFRNKNRDCNQTACYLCSRASS
jgi:hypothetical protein